MGNKILRMSDHSFPCTQFLVMTTKVMLAKKFKAIEQCFLFQNPFNSQQGPPGPCLILFLCSFLISFLLVGMGGWGWEEVGDLGV